MPIELQATYNPTMRATTHRAAGRFESRMMRALIASGRKRSLAEPAECDDPAPARDEVLVRVQATSLNRGELAQLRAAPVGWPGGWDLAEDGMSVLVTGAASGVGRSAVELAARAGARVTALVASPQRAAGLRELGAETVAATVSDVPAERGFDITLEAVGGEPLAFPNEEP